MQIDLSKKIKWLDSSEIDKTIGQVLAEDLAKNPMEGLSSLKAWGWATKLYNNEALSLDKVDAALLQKFITKSTFLAPFVQAQALEIFGLEVE